MKVLKYIFFTLLFIFISNISFSQIKSFSQDSLKYLDEMKAFFETTVNKEQQKEGKEFLEMFGPVWLSPKVTYQQRLQVYKISNQMLKKKMRPFPDFISYLTALESLISSDQPNKTFIAWHSVLDNMLNEASSKNFKTFVDFCNLLFLKKILYESGGVKWVPSNANYSFVYEKEPKVTFQKMDLTCYANSDSGTIQGTKGVFLPIQNKWLGNGGKVTWKRAGLDENKVYAVLDDYHIMLKSSDYTADSVQFFTDYFFKPLLGKLTEKLIPNITSPDKAVFPQFDSYEKRLYINNLFDNIDYTGGFAIHGAKVIGNGSDDKDAYLIVKRNGKIFIVAASKLFMITRTMVAADVAAVSIYLEKDSIYHPAVKLKYLNDTKEFSLFRDEKEGGLLSSPFLNNYHDIDMYFEALYWKTNQPTMDFRMIKMFTDTTTSSFESNGFYRIQKYIKIQGMDQESPLMSVYKYSKKINSNTFTVLGFAAFIGIQEFNARSILQGLASQGFLTFNTKRDKAIISEKLFLYLKAFSGTSDYDVLKIDSKTKNKSNATLDIDKFDLSIEGVDIVRLSDTQKVYILPIPQQIILKKNRDFIFSGNIHSGLFDFWGKDFIFEYDKFKINLTNVDSMSFKVKELNPDGTHSNTYKQVQTVLSNINGDLLIDKPDNKSGLKNNSEYPILIAKSESYVYYDRDFIQKGTYKKERFYFKVKPFKIDSLDNTGTEGIAFNGTLVSGGIFPDIEDSLMVQPDYSLGLVKKTPKEGYPIYGGKGTYFAKIKLSYQGLHGDGSLKYITSTSVSNDFIFLLDSSNAAVQKFDIKEQSGGVEYPNVVAENVYEHWMPYNDVMTVYQRQNPFSFYNGKAKLSGRIDLKPSGLSGTGVMTFYDAELSSNLFIYKQHLFDADTSNLKLRDANSTKLAFNTYNYKSHIDFDKMKGEFKSNGGVSKIEFPINEYIAYMDEFDWDITKKELDLRNTKNQNLAKIEKMNIYELADADFTGSEFISTRPGQDSLRFFSANATFSLNENIIHAKNVKIIKVADAAIYPKNGEVNIHKRAEMETFKSALLLANLETKYHVIYDLTANIYSRKKYSGKGKYDYVTETGEKEIINFDTVFVDIDLMTNAISKIIDTNAFTLSPQYRYIGNVNLYAKNKLLTFDGGFKITSECVALSKSWVKFKSEINAKEIYIPIPEEPYDINNKRILNALLIAPDTNNVYSAFLSPKLHKADSIIVSSYGFLYFDKIAKEFRISDKNKLAHVDSLPGNYLSLNTRNCVVYGEGKLNLGIKLGRVSIETFGNASHYTDVDSTILDLIMALDFYFSEDALKVMVNDFESALELDAVNYQRSIFNKALMEIIGYDNALTTMNEIANYGIYKKMPTEFIHTMFLTDLKMKWNKTTNSYLSEGGRIGVGNFSKTKINKFVIGYMQLSKKKTGDVLTIYFEPSPNTWYFYRYSNGLMEALSSNNDFNKAILDTKEDNRKIEADKGLPYYAYYVSTERKKADFLKLFNK
jgi:hypothetical protein